MTPKRTRSLATLFAALGMGLGTLSLSGCGSFVTILENTIHNATHHSASPTNSSSAASDGTPTDSSDIQVGDCYRLDDPSADGQSVSVVDCSESHDEEAYKMITLADGDYPGKTSVLAQAQSGCTAAFQVFAGISYDDSTSLDFDYYYPSTDSWAQGDREILCAIFETDSDGNPSTTTGSLEGAAR